MFNLYLICIGCLTFVDQKDRSNNFECSKRLFKNNVQSHLIYTSKSLVPIMPLCKMLAVVMSIQKVCVMGVDMCDRCSSV